MKHSRFALSSEQTLRLEALRATLVEALPADMGGRVEFPVVQYGCTYCDYTCTGICMGSCRGNCRGGCKRQCEDVAFV